MQKSATCSSEQVWVRPSSCFLPEQKPSTHSSTHLNEASGPNQQEVQQLASLFTRSKKGHMTLLFFSPGQVTLTPADNPRLLFCSQDLWVEAKLSACGLIQFISSFSVFLWLFHKCFLVWFVLILIFSDVTSDLSFVMLLLWCSSPLLLPPHVQAHLLFSPLKLPPLLLPSLCSSPLSKLLCLSMYLSPLRLSNEGCEEGKP